MKRFHVHMNVANIPSNVKFYSRLFGVEPSVVKADYAKWMLEDPRVNFAISSRPAALGLDHLGLQAENGEELREIGDRLEAADAIALAEKETTCCYARSDKFWAEDPQGTRWESFHTHGDATTYYSPEEAAARTAEKATRGGACCGPVAAH
jgi:hypothetical protein